MTRILLVRHGRTAWNVHERFRGREDVPLDQTGLSQAERTAAYIASRWNPAAVYSTPLARGRATAEAIARRCGRGAHRGQPARHPGRPLPGA